MSDQILINIGKKIRSVRQKQNLKVHELSTKSNISKGLLSKIENGRTVPSLPVLVSIIQALKMNLSSFFEGVNSDNHQDFIHIKKEDYQPFEKEEAKGFSYQFVYSKNLINSSFQVVLLELQPESERDSVTTDGYEFKYMLKGEVNYRLGEKEILFKEGESLFFNGRIPHVPTNRGKEKALMLVIYLLEGGDMRCDVRCEI
jgi:transcriptional regulator with XRE-family HTH domain